jgi:hypothetical protein
MLSTSLLKSVIRLLVMAILVVPFSSILLIEPTDNVTMLFNNSVPYLLMFAALFGCANVIFVKANLVNDDHSGFMPLAKDY